MAQDNPLQKETMSDAFFRQSGIKPGSPEQSQEHAELYGEVGKPGKLELVQQQERLSEAARRMNAPKKSLVEQLNLPTNLPYATDVDMYAELNKSEAETITEMKKEYNGTQDRWKMIGGQGGKGGDIIMEDPYEKL